MLENRECRVLWEKIHVVHILSLIWPQMAKRFEHNQKSCWKQQTREKVNSWKERITFQKKKKKRESVEGKTHQRLEMRSRTSTLHKISHIISIIAIVFKHLIILLCFSVCQNNKIIWPQDVVLGKEISTRWFSIIL